MKEEAKRWIKFAVEDLKIAELAMNEKIFNQVCFHSQQCVEKLLKGCLLAMGKMYPKTHKLADLMHALGESFFRDISENIVALDRFYIPTRYPDALPGSLPDGIPSDGDAKEAIEVAREVLQRAKKIAGE